MSMQGLRAVRSVMIALSLPIAVGCMSFEGTYSARDEAIGAGCILEIQPVLVEAPGMMDQPPVDYAVSGAWTFRGTEPPCRFPDTTGYVVGTARSDNYDIHMMADFYCGDPNGLCDETGKWIGRIDFQGLGTDSDDDLYADILDGIATVDLWGAPVPEHYLTFTRVP